MKVVIYRRFGTPYESCIQGSSISRSRPKF